MFSEQYASHCDGRTMLGRNQCFRALPLTDSASRVKARLGSGIIRLCKSTSSATTHPHQHLVRIPGVALSPRGYHTPLYYLPGMGWDHHQASLSLEVESNVRGSVDQTKVALWTFRTFHPEPDSAAQTW